MSLQTRIGALITSIGADVKSITTSMVRNTQGGREKQGTPSQSSGTLTIDVSTGNVQIAGTVNANITSWVWQNLPASGETCTITLHLPMGGTLRTVSTAIGGTVKWIGAQPTHVINKETIYQMWTNNAGSTWYVQALGGI